MPLDREFEKFKGGPTPPRRDRMYVTINSRGYIFLSKFAYRELGSPPAVNLYFNRPRDIIAIEPTHPRLPLVFPVRKAYEGGRISANPFCKYNNISVPGTQSFVRPEIENGVLYLDLGSIVPVGGWHKKRKPKA